MKTRLLIPIAALATLLLTCLAAESRTPDAGKENDVVRGFLMKSVQVGGKEMAYVVYIPPSYDPAKPMPTIVFLNGAGECGTDGLKPLFAGLGTAVMYELQKWPFIIVLPQKQDVKTKWEDEEPMVMAALDATKREYGVDESRIYLTGLSQGGHGTWAIGAMHPDVFAALAPVCGWGDEAMAKKLVKMPTWIFHGDADDAVKVQCAYEMEGWLKAAGGTCKLTIYPGVGHNSWDKAYREENLGQWFLEHKKE